MLRRTGVLHTRRIAISDTPECIKAASVAAARSSIGRGDAFTWAVAW